MKLRKNEYCPIHRSLLCCGREQANKRRQPRLGVQRVEDPHHPRGYRELRSPSEMRKLINRKIAEQRGICGICHQAFTDCGEIVPYADFGIRDRMPTFRICRPDRFSAEDANTSWFRRRHNPTKRVKSKSLDELFAVDAEARRKTLTTAARHFRRQETARPLLDDIRSNIEAAQSAALPCSALSKACQYALALWNMLTRFLEYPELELSTNLAENSMRPVALGRKNWLHIGSPRAGPKVAAILSIVESCRRLQVPVRDYFSAILPGSLISRSGAFQTLLPLCGSPDIHRLE